MIEAVKMLARKCVNVYAALCNSLSMCSQAIIAEWALLLSNPPASSIALHEQEAELTEKGQRKKWLNFILSFFHFYSHKTLFLVSQPLSY